MVNECIHICATGQKCRRLPKRGQKYCTAHHPNRRRRRPGLEDDAAFQAEISAWIDRLRAMTLDDLLYTVTGALAEVHPLIDRRCSRQRRGLFHRAWATVAVAADRFYDARMAQTHRAVANSQPPCQQLPAPANPPTPPARAASLTPAQHAEATAMYQTLTSGAELSPEHLGQLCDRLLTTLDSNNSIPSTFISNR